MKPFRSLILPALVLTLTLPAAASQEDASDGKTPARPAPADDASKQPPATDRSENPPSSKGNPDTETRVCMPQSPSDAIGGVNTLEDLYRAIGFEWALARPAAPATAEETEGLAAIRWTVRNSPAN